MDELLHGRREITTSCLPIQMQPPDFIGSTLNSDTLPAELNNALMIHLRNQEDILRLRKIYLNGQKIYNRSNEDRLVNNKVAIPHQKEYTRQITGYTYPNGIQFVQNKLDYMNDVDIINRFLRAQNKIAFDKIMADEQSIYGTHFRAVMPDTVQFDSSPIEIYRMDILNTFVAYSAYNSMRPVYAWNCFKVKKPTGEERYIHQVYTAYVKYTYNASSKFCVQPTDLISVRSHILGDVPIIEYANNEFRLGDWELEVGVTDAINSMASDGVNDVEQCIKSYLALFGVDPDQTDLKKAKKEHILVFKGAAGINQDAKFITSQLDGQSAELLRTYLEGALARTVGIPDRNSSGGGDTGEAINAKNGWREIDTVAKAKTMYTEMAERRFLKIVLNILSPKYIPSTITPLDIDIKIPRNKDENLLTKVQAGQIMDQMGFDELDTVEHMDITGDAPGLAKRWQDSKKARAAEQPASAGTSSKPKGASEQDPPASGDPNSPEDNM